MYFPGGRSKYARRASHLPRTSGLNPARRVQRLEFTAAYALSKYRTNVAEPDGSGGDYS
jgi:hypothetical protein